ncbi:MAG TPA: choice-of-anchor tandem repeat GloVer-containing protein [Candidatus Solibacter sp.]|nr:choice-of-anchor tandem repeat GloVer-containing protein [Candidatus Solibacter sp.]
MGVLVVAAAFFLLGAEDANSQQAAPKYTVLYNFSGPDGKNPNSPLINDTAGNLYGSAGGGIENLLRCETTYCGVVYKLDPSGNETVVHEFNTGSSGNRPCCSSLQRDGSGNLYGTTWAGGISGGCIGSDFEGCGVAFTLDPTGKEDGVYTFGGPPDGSHPGSLIADSLGDRYGVAWSGGNQESEGLCALSGCGVIWKVDRSGNETILHRFSGDANGFVPTSLIRDGAGDFYGTTGDGGNFVGVCSEFGCGVIFELDPSGNETVLYRLSGQDGYFPNPGLIRDSDGNLYGTTEGGGNTGGLCAVYESGCGVVFKLDHSGNATVLHRFTGGADGARPAWGLVRDSAGNLYGTTPYGGSGSGVVFKLNRSGKETVLHTFSAIDGQSPTAGLLLYAGVLYGTTSAGGTNGDGVVFKLQLANAENRSARVPATR